MVFLVSFVLSLLVQVAEEEDVTVADCVDWDKSLAVKREKLNVRVVFSCELVAFSRRS